MRAAVITGAGAVEVTTLPDPAPGPREVVVAVAACGICGTDLHILAGGFAPRLPVVPGHEFAGEVVAVGSEVEARDGIGIGDLVAVDPSLYCGECYQCRRARGNQCERWRAIGVTEAGGAAEFVAAPVANCVRLPAGIEVADAALVEPLSCAVHGYDVLRSRLADTVLIYGAGTMGLIMLSLAGRVGAGPVDVVDPNADRLATAVRLGCAGAAAAAGELQSPGGRGWDVVIDATGAVGAIEDGIGRVAPGGTFLQFGVADSDATARYRPYRVYREEITIAGSMAVLHSFERAAALFATGALDPSVLITHRYPLADFPAALAQAGRGEGGKIQVLPG